MGCSDPVGLFGNPSVFFCFCKVTITRAWGGRVEKRSQPWPCTQPGTPVTWGTNQHQVWVCKEHQTRHQHWILNCQQCNKIPGMSWRSCSRPDISSGTRHRRQPPAASLAPLRRRGRLPANSEGKNTAPSACEGICISNRFFFPSPP